MKWLCWVGLHNWYESPRRRGLGMYPEHRKCACCLKEQVCNGYPWFMWFDLDEDQMNLYEDNPVTAHQAGKDEY